MDVTKPTEFLGFGAMDVTKPTEFLGFGAMDVTKPHICLQGLVTSMTPNPKCIEASPVAPVPG